MQHAAKRTTAHLCRRKCPSSQQWTMPFMAALPIHHSPPPPSNPPPSPPKSKPPPSPSPPMSKQPPPSSPSPSSPKSPPNSPPPLNLNLEPSGFPLDLDGMQPMVNLLFVCWISQKSSNRRTGRVCGLKLGQGVAQGGGTYTKRKEKKCTCYSEYGTNRSKWFTR